MPPAAAVAAAVQAKVPWAAIQVHKGFGVATAAHFGDNAYVLSWPSVESGALPLEGGVAVAFHREIAAAEDPEAKRKEIEANGFKTYNDTIAQSLSDVQVIFLSSGDGSPLKLQKPLAVLQVSPKA